MLYSERRPPGGNSRSCGCPQTVNGDSPRKLSSFWIGVSIVSGNSFWGGVAAGVAGTAAGLWVCGLLASPGRMVRVERSIQIGRPALEVFSAFARIERIPQLIHSVVNVVSCEDVSVWISEIDGHRFQWDVEIVQVVPKQVIGWTSFRGPRHSGRISFFSLGDGTLVHVAMNYMPRVRIARILNRPVNMGDAIEAALRDCKSTLESARSRWAIVPPFETYEALQTQATGTYGHRLSRPDRESESHSEHKGQSSTECQQASGGDHSEPEAT